jgi:hypothetical protein
VSKILNTFRRPSSFENDDCFDARVEKTYPTPCARIQPSSMANAAPDPNAPVNQISLASPLEVISKSLTS